MADLSSAAKSLALSDDLEKTQQERINIFYDYVKVCAQKKTIGNIFKQIISMMCRYVKEQLVLCIALLREE